jgi:hypothetical protein
MLDHAAQLRDALCSLTAAAVTIDVGLNVLDRAAGTWGLPPAQLGQLDGRGDRRGGARYPLQLSSSSSLDGWSARPEICVQ